MLPLDVVYLAMSEIENYSSSTCTCVLFLQLCLIIIMSTPRLSLTLTLTLSPGLSSLCVSNISHTHRNLELSTTSWSSAEEWTCSFVSAMFCFCWISFIWSVLKYLKDCSRRAYTHRLTCQFVFSVFLFHLHFKFGFDLGKSCVQVFCFFLKGDN